MRKAIIIIIMGILCIGYFFAVQEKGKEEIQSNIESPKPLIPEGLMDKSWETPEEVLETHNDLMKIAYRSRTTQEDIPLIVEKMRILYSSDFLDLNNEKNQQVALAQELASNEVIGLYLVDSEIDYIKFVESEEAVKEKEVEAKIVHHTTKGDQQRMYKLIEEEGKWKIYSWENLETETLNE